MNSIESRFWGKVDKSGECWNWTGSRKPQGYGQFNISGVPRYAHRVSYELAFGRIPAGALIRHKCDNPLCVRPSHLEPGDQKQNMHDMISRGRAVHRGIRGERNSAAKLTDCAVAEIRTDRSSTLSELARRFGVSPQRISQIQQRKLRVGKPVEVQP